MREEDTEDDMTEEELDGLWSRACNWHMLMLTDQTAFSLIALARKGLLWENQEQMIKEYDADKLALTPSPQDGGLVERLRDEAVNIAQDYSGHVARTISEAADALERMAPLATLHVRDSETIINLRETITALRTENERLRKVLSDWDIPSECWAVDK